MPPQLQQRNLLWTNSSRKKMVLSFFYPSWFEDSFWVLDKKIFSIINKLFLVFLSADDLQLFWLCCSFLASALQESIQMLVCRECSDDGERGELSFGTKLYSTPFCNLTLKHPNIPYIVRRTLQPAETKQTSLLKFASIWAETSCDWSHKKLLETTDIQ